MNGHVQCVFLCRKLLNTAPQHARTLGMICSMRPGVSAPPLKSAPVRIAVHPISPYVESCGHLPFWRLQTRRNRGQAVAHHSTMTCNATGNTAAVKPIVVVGSLNADLVVKVNQLPQPGETIAGSSLDFFPGGKVGSDSNADALKAALQQYGVQLDQLRQVEGPSGTALILLQPSGENSIIIVGGANTCHWELTPAALQLVASAGAVLLQREVPEAVNHAVAAAAASAGVPVMLDAGGQDVPLPERLLPLLTYCSPNETELARLTGLPTSSRNEMVAAARILLAKGVQQALVKLGAQGCMLLQGPDAEPIWQPARSVPQVVDTTGAGDCFTAAFMVGLQQGLAPQPALQWATAAASLCVQRPGAMPSMPSREEVEAVL